MRVLYDGKTNRVLKSGRAIVLQFKDSILGDSSGRVDPGGDFVVGETKGKGVASAKATAHFFSLLKKAGIPNHFVKVRSDSEIEIRMAKRIPIEVIYRALAYGSFLRRYAGYVQPMAKLDIVEFTLKADALGDPMLEREVIVKLGLANRTEVNLMEKIARKAAGIIADDLVKRSLRLVDLKLEFGRIGRKLLVIDSLSGDTMRVYDEKQGKVLDQIELARGLGLIN